MNGESYTFILRSADITTPPPLGWSYLTRHKNMQFNTNDFISILYSNINFKPLT